jgi:hypothetical protein
VGGTTIKRLEVPRKGALELGICPMRENGTRFSTTGGYLSGDTFNLVLHSVLVYI